MAYIEVPSTCGDKKVQPDGVLQVKSAARIPAAIVGCA
jgi:hypothetical protein